MKLDFEDENIINQEVLDNNFEERCLYITVLHAKGVDATEVCLTMPEILKAAVLLSEQDC